MGCRDEVMTLKRPSLIQSQRHNDPDPIPLGDLVPITLENTTTAIDVIAGNPGVQYGSPHSHIPRSRSAFSKKRDFSHSLRARRSASITARSRPVISNG
jgi:hypothetical protein